MATDAVDAPRRSAGGRVPPHSLQAEESLLGAMLLSRDAIAAAVEVVHVEDFYKPAHAHVFEAVTALYGAGEPADPVTVAEELRRAGLLDAVGGTGALLAIQAATPATTSASRYARIIEEHAMLRRLIGVAAEISERAYNLPDDVAKAIDEAESKVYDVAQRRVTDSMSPIGDLLSENLDRLEDLYERGERITGVPTGYVDLDEMLSGLQPSNLVVVGARPSVGKTSFTLGLATHAALETGRPVLVFSLEMSRSELSQRILCSEAGVNTSKVRTGSLSPQDWTKLTNAVGRLAEAPIYIDDNPNVTIMEIRAKARRLRSKIGDLALVAIDYVQLMTGRSSAESRQVEVSEISRGLKILARELETPVLALAQLNRQLEARADKRPMLSDLRESGCLTAGTRLLRADTNEEVTLGELVDSGAREVPVWSLDDEWRLVPAVLSHAFPSGVKRVYRLQLASGRTVEATANHRFRTLLGWAALGELDVGSALAVPRTLAAPDGVEPADADELVLLAHLLGEGGLTAGHVVQCTDTDPANLDAVELAAHRRFGISARRVRQGSSWHSYLPPPTPPVRPRDHPVIAWWAALGLPLRLGTPLFVPTLVHRAPTAQVRGFLRHLWAACGTFSVAGSPSLPSVRIHLDTTSRGFADDVQRLLLRLGVEARVITVPHGAERNAYVVRVDGAEQQRLFLERVGVHGRRGAGAVQAVDWLSGSAGDSPGDLIPAPVRGQVLAALQAAHVSQRFLATELGEPYCGSYHLGSDARPRAVPRSRLAMIARVTGDKDLAALASADVAWDRVVAIEPLGMREVFDATVLGTHNFVANGIVAHNSLEQDADVVLFLYRDEIYNPESPDRGTAEVIVAKHRSGPTGKVRLAWLDHFTKFADMAKNV
jgi:replicative DNA helicase